MIGAAFLRTETYEEVEADRSATLQAMLVLVGCNYLFKVAVAALDTLPFYLGVHYLGRYLRIDPRLGAGTHPTDHRPPFDAQQPH